ncbi:MAG: hypothetical protein IT326_08905 [Anaerolineae bacterium]|nr:hypothetical protein [Anaerolineae bacterium]
MTVCYLAWKGISVSTFDPFDEFSAEQPAMLEEAKPTARKPRRSGGGGCYNIVALFFLFATAGAAALAAAIALNPAAPYNPFPPGRSVEATPTLFQLSEATDSMAEEGVGGGSTEDEASLQSLDLTATAPMAFNPTGPPITPTEIPFMPGATSTRAIFPFTLQNDAVTYTENSNERGCQWASIAGQVFDIDGQPLTRLPVQVTGEDFQSVQFTGSATAFGPSGYEVMINENPLVAEFEVRLLSTTGMPLSEPIIVRTLDSCDRNVAIVNFVQNYEFTN